MDEENDILQECYDKLIEVNEQLCDVPGAKKINDRLDRLIRALSDLIEVDEDSWN